MNPEIDISKVKLNTPRLLLRPWRSSDLDDFYEYASVDGVGQMAGWKPHANMLESREILNSFIEGRRTFALDYQGKVIGSIGIESYNEEQFPEFDDMRCRELGFVLSKDYWGQGLMPEAVSEVVRYLFEEEDLDAIFCSHFMANTRSHRVQEKCGFHHYAFGRYKTAIGTVEDEVINILTREEWEKRSGK